MNFRENITRLLTQPAIENEAYYWITIRLDASARVELNIQTQWCGYTEDKPRREIREGSLHDGEYQRAACFRFGETALLINDINDVPYFYAFGGHALVIEGVAQQKFERLISPHVSLRDSGGLGFRRASGLEEAQLQHAPSKKLRMEILNRDKRRCLICGRSPMYYVDVELHVHHAIPWGRGGITEEANLISLCKTCHDGLAPHEDQDLIRYLTEKYPRPSTGYLDDLKKYQDYVRQQLTKK
ncbi:hypothetical protein GTP58_26885 [Duganella sp. CY15W]|uniref:HNH endonuclease n=1 Tax=Duganella sp. CY15W TaxID=2692172 RepID=UPI00136B1D92|nr:HNH endonuclease [Duganella sp. CY15W]MYM31963.1 hypothetical protein [Duganella sp. CY15W]